MFDCIYRYLWFECSMLDIIFSILWSAWMLVWGGQTVFFGKSRICNPFSAFIVPRIDLYPQCSAWMHSFFKHKGPDRKMKNVSYVFCVSCTRVQGFPTYLVHYVPPNKTAVHTLSVQYPHINSPPWIRTHNFANQSL